MPPPLPLEEITQLMRFVATKTKNVTSPINVMELSRLFKEETGSLVVLTTLIARIRTSRLKIHEMYEFDMKTKVKMMFALSAPIDAGFLKKLKKVADVEVDDQRRIIRYKQKDGGLELSGKHLGVPMKKGEKRSRELIQFLTEKSEKTEKPIPDRVLMREFKEKTRCTSSMETLEQQYRRVKETIYQSFEIDRNTKIKIMFISNVKLHDDFLEELREDADVEVDYKRRITKYKSKDGSLELEGIDEYVHSMFIRMEASRTDMKRRWQESISTEFLKIVKKETFVELDEMKRIKKYKANNGSLELEGDHASNGSTGEKYSQSTSLSQNLPAIQKGRERVRQISEQDDDREPLKVEDALAVDLDTNNADDGRYNYCDYDPPGYEEDMVHILEDKKPENLIEIKTEVQEMSSASIGGDHFFFDYDPPNYEKNLEHIPEEKKPENYIEVKLEIPDGPSTSNFEYHYEENTDHILIEPKPEVG